MTFLKGETNEDEARISEAYSSLKNRLIAEFTAAYIDNTPKMIWKTLSVYQCLIRRTLEAADGVRIGWEAENVLTAVTMARSLFETAAIVMRRSAQVEAASLSRDVDALDDAIMYAGFATRLKEMLEKNDEYPAKSIMDAIDKADALLGGTEYKLRPHYEFLCEIAHPNHLGILGIYSHTLAEPFSIKFGGIDWQRENILSNLHVALATVVLVERCVTELEKLIPEMATFVPSAVVGS
jgi:hypothetical protein